MTLVSSNPESQLPTMSGTMMFKSSHSQIFWAGSSVRTPAMIGEKSRKHFWSKGALLDTVG